MQLVATPAVSAVTHTQCGGCSCAIFVLCPVWLWGCFDAGCKLHTLCNHQHFSTACLGIGHDRWPATREALCCTCSTCVSNFVLGNYCDCSFLKNVKLSFSFCIESARRGITRCTGSLRHTECCTTCACVLLLCGGLI